MTSPTAPSARRAAVVENLHGHQVADPYRWLEDASDPEVQQWSAAQDDWFEHHRAQWSDRPAWEQMLKRLTPEQWAQPPVCRDPYRFFQRLSAGAPHPALWAQRSGEEARVLIDPQRLDSTGLTRLVAWRPSWEGDRLAYLTSTAGSDLTQLWVLSVEDGTVLDGPVTGMRSPSLAWCPGGQAFYYVRGTPTSPADASSADGYGMQVLRHRVGTPTQDDEYIFGRPAPNTYYSVSTDRHGSRLAVTTAHGSSAHNDVHLAVVPPPGSPWHFTTVVEGDATGSQWRPRFAPDATLHLLTDYHAPGGRILTYPATEAQDDPDQWPELLPHQPGHLLDDCVWLDPPTVDGGTLLALTTHRTTGELTLHTSDGRYLRHLPLPGTGAVCGLRSRPEGGQDAWFLYTDHAIPSTVLHWDARTQQAPTETTPHQTKAPNRPTRRPDIISRQVTCPTPDGADIDVHLLTPADTDRPRPLLLTAYGGFGAFVRPTYSPLARAWVEAGGTYALAGVRGGGDCGTDWHHAGRRAHKKTAINDFNTAAAWLIDHNHTTSEQLAAHGGSHGGLLVTAALTQRPDLYTAVVANGPLCDMVRYEQLGIGHTWTEEFGTASDPEHLTWLLSYSPYHHVRPATAYPAVLLAGAVTDERTGDAHPRKMCAALQHSNPHGKPVLLRRQPNSGHGPTDNTTAIHALTDILTFLATHTGLQPPRSTIAAAEQE
ncbi:prolyl oligopeptidase family serine peptidase [Streptomyces tauricus]|uniref:prolyl oligopeptidase family serine peptidase n=1 Tax=Streptomyces tauricus TaxID=68274 RepID=UPI00381E8BF6